ncbi:hypothetical protein HW555_004846 [Spodoptera exigua]|uniref:MG17 n=1 Tax=Spodoptera exigua TaxID=7107 RepID=A0A835L538_SPOEX|nr:hypothetical protein HW555_004846 [Spodoptera exigua]
MKSFVALFALLAVAAANPLPLVQIIVNVDAPSDVAVGPAIVPEPIKPSPVHIVDEAVNDVPVIPEPVIIPEPVFPDVVVPEPVVMPEPVLPEVVVVPEPVVMPEPVLPEVEVGPVVALPEELN